MLNAPAILLLGAVLVTLWMAWRSGRLPHFPGRVNFVAMQLSASWWATAAALEILAVAPDDKLFWAKMAWIGIVGAPSFWTLFIWSYIHGELRPRWRLIPIGMGLLTWAVAMTNDWHRLMYVSAIPINDQPGAALDYSHGFWFFATTVYLYAFMVLSVVVTASGIHRAAPAYRAHYLGFLLAMAVPWMANIGYVTGNAFLFDFDPTPFSFLLMGSVFYWLITRRRLFALLPVARHALLDAVPDPVLVLDADGTVVEANPAALALSAAPGGLIGRRLADLPDLGPALAERNVPTDGLQARLVSLGQGAGRRAFEATRVALVSGALASGGERSVGHLLLLRDVTHRRRVEARLEETVQRLDAARAEAEARLAAEQEAKHALNSYLSMAAHEFKTPLAIIDSAAQLLMMEAERNAPSMLPRLDKIRQAVRRQVNLLESCLADDRLSHPTVTLRMERIDLPALLRAVAEAAPNDDAGDPPIKLNLTDCPARLIGDSALLELCVHNLLGNALKYSPPGGWVELRAWTERAEDGRPLAVLAVTDQGIGVPPDALPHIFDRFFRAPNASGAAGSGVGLNMVRRIATLHGGTIQVDSQLGVGSRFTLTLPTDGADQDADSGDGMAAIAQTPPPNHSSDR